MMADDMKIIHVNNRALFEKIKKILQEKKDYWESKYPGCFDSAATYRKKQKLGLLPPEAQVPQEEAPSKQ
jgi:hypothetical protein